VLIPGSSPASARADFCLPLITRKESLPETGNFSSARSFAVKFKGTKSDKEHYIVSNGKA